MRDYAWDYARTMRGLCAEECLAEGQSVTPLTHFGPFWPELVGPLGPYDDDVISLKNLKIEFWRFVRGKIEIGRRGFCIEVIKLFSGKFGT